MKKTKYISVLFICISVLITSCTKESKIKSKINEYVEKNFNDPDSYELVELKLIDTLTQDRASKYLIDKRIKDISEIEKFIKNKRMELSRLAWNAFISRSALTLSSAVSNIEDQQKELKSLESDSINIRKVEIDKLKKYTHSKEIVYYRYLHEFRAKNDVGALVKISDTIRIDLDYNIISSYKKYLENELIMK